MKYLFLASVMFASMALAGDTPQAIPPDATKIMAAHDKAVAAAKAAYDAAVAKADENALKALNPVVIKFTRAGDLKNATAVKAIQDELTAKIAKPGGDSPTAIALILARDGQGIKVEADSPIQLAAGIGDSGFTLAASENGPAVVATGAFLQFKLTPAVRNAVKGHDFKMVVRSSIPCSMQYETEATAYTECKEKTSSQQDKVIVSEFSISKANFTGRQNGGGDFRFVIPTGKLYSVQVVK